MAQQAANTNTKIQWQTVATLVGEHNTLTQEAREVSDRQIALGHKLRTAEEAYTIVKTILIAANNCILDLLIDSEKIELVKTDLSIRLNNKEITVKHRLEELLKAVPMEYWSKHKSSSNRDGHPVAKQMLI